MTSLAPSRRLTPDFHLLWVGLGIAVYGLSSFAFLAVAAHQIGNGPGYTALALLWTLLNAVGIGLYLPVEQETARQVASRRSLGEPTRPAIGRPLRYSACSLAVVVTAAVLLDPVLSEPIFAGQRRMAIVLALGLVGMAVAYLARGTLSGNGRFARYGSQLALDGVLRVSGAAVLATAHVSNPVSYGAVLAGAPVVATVAVLVGSRSLLTPGPRSSARAVGMSTLVFASLASQALANAGPVAAQLLASSDEAGTAANLVNALTIARIPLFLFAAVQAVFLPRLAAHVARDARRAFVAALGRAAAWTSGIGAFAVVLTGVFGPLAVRLLFGKDFAVDRGTIILLAFSAVTFMVAQLVIQALLARRRDADATASWLAGFAALLAALLLPWPLSTRVASALVVGSACAAITAIVRLRRNLIDWQPLQAQS